MAPACPFAVLNTSALVPADHTACTELTPAYLRGVRASTVCSNVTHTFMMPMLQVEATNELGDVYAHFGSWKEAVQAWNDALDCIIGPYQVIGSAGKTTCCTGAAQQCGQLCCHLESCKCCSRLMIIVFPLL